jgi:hypothetical protein
LVLEIELSTMQIMVSMFSTTELHLAQGRILNQYTFSPADISLAEK